MTYKEIHREIEYGSDKIRLTLYFPSEPSSFRPSDALREEIRAILGRELITQLRCRKTTPENPECTRQASIPQKAGKALP